MFIELHLVQSFAPSNLNRDDTGSPKECVFGGVRRARISSQSLKRAMRLNPVFADTTGVTPALRTKYMTRMLSAELADKLSDDSGYAPSQEQVQAVSAAFVENFSKKLDRSNPEAVRTPVLLYISAGEIDLIASKLANDFITIAADLDETGKAGEAIKQLVKVIIKATKNHTSAPDVALFGRMLADRPELNIDAAVQVAHALSTHRVEMEMDYYTAVDDVLREDEAGAGMVGYTGYNSATFYRYARIDFEQLVANLHDDKELARKTVSGFIRTAQTAVPSGKQNAFAAQNTPSMIMAVVRSDKQSWSLANAFETPVRAAREGGYVSESLAELSSYWGKLDKAYGSDGVASFYLSLEDEFEITGNNATACDSITDLVEMVDAMLAEEAN